VAVFRERLGKMATDESGPTCHENSHTRCPVGQHYLLNPMMPLESLFEGLFGVVDCRKHFTGIFELLRTVLAGLLDWIFSKGDSLPFQ